MIRLRDATQADLTLIMSWRSNPLIYQGFYQQKEPLKWQEHIDWWGSRNKDWWEFIIVLIEGTQVRDVGVLTLGQLDYWEFEIGVMIGEVTLWGKGIAKEAVRLGIEKGKKYGKNYCRTTILDNNERSIRLFKSLGFKRVGDARPGESLYRKELSSADIR